MVRSQRLGASRRICLYWTRNEISLTTTTSAVVYRNVSNSKAEVAAIGCGARAARAHINIESAGARLGDDRFDIHHTFDWRINRLCRGADTKLI